MYAIITAIHAYRKEINPEVHEADVLDGITAVFTLYMSKAVLLSDGEFTIDESLQEIKAEIWKRVTHVRRRRGGAPSAN
jgi:hypothetical protein